eukprot:12135356-Ditylum_brightwellii.AAC.1
MKFKAELDEAMRRKRCYKGNLIKAYTLLWEQCSKLMHNKLKERTDFQSKGELSVTGLHSQVQDNKNVLESHIGGGLQLPKCATTLVNTNTNKEQSLQKAPEHLLVFMYLKNADQAKYGSVLMNLNQQKSLGNNQYTKTVTESTNVLSNHRFDNYKL